LDNSAPEGTEDAPEVLVAGEGEDRFGQGALVLEGVEEDGDSAPLGEGLSPDLCFSIGRKTLVKWSLFPHILPSFTVFMKKHSFGKIAA
jgi:hypothetical protein